MTTTASTTSSSTRGPDPVSQMTANEFGQLTGLEAGVTYFVVRKPTPEYTREKSRELLDEVKTFLHEHRALTEQQVKDLQTKYGEPAKEKAKEFRETLERRFDDIARELEARFEKLETEINERAPKVFRKDKTAETSTGTTTDPKPETPGEMPR